MLTPAVVEWYVSHRLAKALRMLADGRPGEALAQLSDAIRLLPFLPVDVGARASTLAVAIAQVGVEHEMQS